MKMQDKVLSRNIRGAMWKIFSCFCFACINGIVKHMTTRVGGGLSFSAIAFWENVFAIMALWPLLRWHRFVHNFDTVKPYMMRGLISMAGVCLWYQSLRYIPLHTAISLAFMGPIFTIGGAAWLLQEKITTHRVLAVIVGLIGGGIITQDCMSYQMTWYVLLPIFSSICFSGASLMAKHMTKRDCPNVVTYYILLATTPMWGIFSLWEFSWPMGYDWSLLLALGGLTAGAHWGMIRAFACADIIFLMPFGSSRLLLSAAIGWLFFQETPSGKTFLGSAIILVAIYHITYKEGRDYRPQSKTPKT